MNNEDQNTQAPIEPEAPIAPVDPVVETQREPVTPSVEVSHLHEPETPEEPVKKEVPSEFNCPNCEGTGLKDQYTVCPVCAGKGKV